MIVGSFGSKAEARGLQGRKRGEKEDHNIKQGGHIVGGEYGKSILVEVYFYPRVQAISLPRVLEAPSSRQITRKPKIVMSQL